MKKVMLISPMLHQGGFERICVMTARMLQKKYDVTIVVFSLDDIAFDISGLKVIDLDLKSKPGKMEKVLNVVKRVFALSRLQKRLGTDISYSFGTTANIANALTWGAKKKITACHSFEEIKGSGYMKLIGRHSDLVLCCSKKMADLIKKMYSFSNIKALWNPCDIEGIIEQSEKTTEEDVAFFKTEEKVLVSMGREDDVKGFWHLLKAFRRIQEEEENTKLAIIGDGDFSEYEKLAEELHIRDKVLFAGLKKNPFPYLKASDYYVLTSLSEGLPNALVEALALSVPIVSVNCLSGPAEILHEDWKAAEEEKQVFEADFGILAPVFCPDKDMSVTWEADGRVKLDEAQEAFASAVLKMMREDTLSKVYQDRAFDRAKEFSKEKHIDGLISYMETL